MNIAVIPARGGSKRIPMKNMLRFGGKPMLVWTIEAAIYSNLFDKIIVSTDDWEIAGTAEDAGAEVLIREGLADDDTPTSLVTIDVVSKYGGDTICQLLPTCPLRTYHDVIDAYDAFKKSSAPAQISITDFGWQTPQWAVDKRAKIIFEDEFFKRSQDLPSLYHPTGAVWFADSTPLILNKSFYMRGLSGWFIPWMRAIDIDTPEDLAIAKMILRGR
jgi:N-acylneuraminate cytidylyltransferase